MKRSLLILSALVLGMGAKAQITITMADIAYPTTVIKQAIDTLPATALVGNSGISQTWNMSSLATHELDTLTFCGPSWGGSAAASFPTANIAVKINSQGSVAYAYANISSSSFNILGQSSVQDFGGGPSTVIQKTNPGELLVNFPSTYLSNFVSNYTTEATFYFGVDPGIGVTIDSIRQKSIVNKTTNSDAWGTITTPLITTPTQCLRYYNVKMTNDSLWAYSPLFGGWTFVQATMDTTYQYSWWANGIGFPLVEADVDASDVPTRMTWLQATPSVGIEEAAMSSLNVYPNPAQNDVTFALDPSMVSAVQVFDATGRMINTYPVMTDNVTINTAEFANGIYTFSLLGKDRETLNRGKFTVAK